MVQDETKKIEKEKKVRKILFHFWLFSFPLFADVTTTMINFLTLCFIGTLYKLDSKHTILSMGKIEEKLEGMGIEIPTVTPSQGEIVVIFLIFITRIEI